jgi:hypothetical protein
MSEDDAAAFLLRYLRAAQEGAARLNLRLMARVVVGKAHAGEPLYADEFLRYADTLASLARNEVVLLGALIRHNAQPHLPGNPVAPGVRAWVSLRQELCAASRAERPASTARTSRCEGPPTTVPSSPPRRSTSCVESEPAIPCNLKPLEAMAPEMRQHPFC